MGTAAWPPEGAQEVIATAEQGGTVNDIGQRRRPERSRGREDVDLSRELHDHVSQTLNLLLLEMENFKAEQVGREGVLRELDRMQGSIRSVLSNVHPSCHSAPPTKAKAPFIGLRPLSGRTVLAGSCAPSLRSGARSLGPNPTAQ